MYSSSLTTAIHKGKVLWSNDQVYIGLHAIFGAFLLGAVIPHDSAVAGTFTRQVESVVTVLLPPAFFAFTGLRTRIDLVSGLDQWLSCKRRIRERQLLSSRCICAVALPSHP